MPAPCRTCKNLRLRAVVSTIFYTLDVGSDVMLGVQLLREKNLEEGIPTLFFVALPFFAVILVNYLEENLKVDVSRGCCHYFGFLPPRSKWKKFSLHQAEQHDVHNEDERQQLAQQGREEEMNAAILEDVVQCFESAPQLIFQLTDVFNGMATFDGNLQGAITLTNVSQLVSIFFSAMNVLRSLFLKMEKKNLGSTRNRIQYNKERRLAFMCIFGRVSLILSYASIGAVTLYGILLVAGVHWLAAIIWLACSGNTRLICLEAALHVFQYVTWAPSRDPHSAMLGLVVTAVSEWLVFVAMFVYVCMVPPQPVFIVFKVGFFTHVVIFFFAVCELVRFAYRLWRPRPVEQSTDASP